MEENTAPRSRFVFKTGQGSSACYCTANATRSGRPASGDGLRADIASMHRILPIMEEYDHDVCDYVIYAREICASFVTYHFRVIKQA